MPMVKGLTERNPSGCAIFSSDSVHDIVVRINPVILYRASALTALLHSKLVRRALGPIAMEFQCRTMESSSSSTPRILTKGRDKQLIY
jgi:hypothetical protein